MIYNRMRIIIFLMIMTTGAYSNIFAENVNYIEMLGDLAGKTIEIQIISENNHIEKLKCRIIDIKTGKIFVRAGDSVKVFELNKVRSIKATDKHNIAFKPIYILFGIGVGVLVAMGIVSATSK